VALSRLNFTWHVNASPVLGPDETVYVSGWNKTLYAVKDVIKMTLQMEQKSGV